MRRDLAITAFGIGGGQLLVLAATPVLARVYSPADFGVYATVAALAGVVATVASLRLDTAIPAAVDSDVPLLSKIAIFLPFVVVPIFVLLVLVFQTIMSGWGAMWSFNVDLLWVVCAIATFQGVVAVGIALCTRFGQFRVSSAIKILQPLGFVVAALLLVNNLTTALALGWATALLAAILMFRKIPIFSGWCAAFKAVRRAWRYPILSAPVALLDTLALALPVLFIASAYGEGSAGNYSQVQRLIGAPLVLAGMAVGQVFYKYAGDLQRNKQPVRPLMWKTVSGLFLMALLLLSAVFFGGQWLLTLLLGDSWRTDTFFIALALLPIIFRMVISPVSSVFLLYNRLGLGASWQALYFFVTFCVLVWAREYTNFDGMLIALAISEFVMYLAYLTLSLRAAATLNP